MALVFDDVRLPVDIEIGARGGMGWQTTVTPLGSGAEQINQDWSEHRCYYDVGYGISSFDDLRDVKAFHAARRGRARHFRFKDWTDFELDLELIGVGDGSNKIFPVIKTYEPSGPHPYVRRITRPIVATFDVYKDGVLVAPSAYDLDDGVVTFTSAPSNTLEVRITCEFDVPVRFDVDRIDINIEAFEAGEIMGITLIEGRE